MLVVVVLVVLLVLVMLMVLVVVLLRSEEPLLRCAVVSPQAQGPLMTRCRCLSLNSTGCLSSNEEESTE